MIRYHPFSCMFLFGPGIVSIIPGRFDTVHDNYGVVNTTGSLGSCTHCMEFQSLLYQQCELVFEEDYHDMTLVGGLRPSLW